MSNDGLKLVHDFLWNLEVAFNFQCLVEAFSIASVLALQVCPFNFYFHG